MQCEVCGREITGKLNRVVIEGAKMITCAECAKLGSDYWILTQVDQKRDALRSSRKLTTNSRDHFQQSFSFNDLEIIENFGSIIKRAREKLGLTPEDLGKMIGEKESVIKKIESEKVVPDIRVTVKLERALKIKLLVRQLKKDSGGLPNNVFMKNKRSITLGEIVQIKGDEGDERRREQ